MPLLTFDTIFFFFFFILHFQNIPEDENKGSNIFFFFKYIIFMYNLMAVDDTTTQ